MKFYSKAAALGAMLYCILSNTNICAEANPFEDGVSMSPAVLLSTEFQATEGKSEAAVSVKEDETVNTVKPDTTYNIETCYYKDINLNDQSLYPCEGSCNVKYGQNVRKSPWGTIMTTYKTGTKVTIVAKEGDWYKIEYNGNGGFAYLHYSLVDTKYAPAYDGIHEYPYSDEYVISCELAAKNNFGKNTNSKIATKASILGSTDTEVAEADDDSEDYENDNSNLSGAAINGPDIPDCIKNAIPKAKKTKWFTTNDKCLQYIGTVAYYAGAKVKQSDCIYPHNCYKPMKTFRGYLIKDLKKPALQGKILPGQLVHVKVAYDKDPAYNPSTNAHHWFMYAGLQNGVPMWCDCLHDGKFVTTEKMASTMSGGRCLQPQYKPYGNVRRVSAIYDPFADQR